MFVFQSQMIDRHIEKPLGKGAITRRGARPWNKIIGLQGHSELFSCRGLSDLRGL